jgi:hypothetical protein
MALRQTFLWPASASNVLQKTDDGGSHEESIMTFRQRCDASHCLRPATPGFNLHLLPAAEFVFAEDLTPARFSRAGICCHHASPERIDTAGRTYDVEAQNKIYIDSQ